MRYEGTLYRPPSEADSLILQATIGCSWNHCTYCDMYRSKEFRVRPLEESLSDLSSVPPELRPHVEKLFVADGDALILPSEHWLAILERARELFPRLRRVSCYAMAGNILEKDPADLRRLREGGLSLLYIGPESGDDPTLRRIAKGSTHEEHVEAARRAKEAGMSISAIFLLGAGGVARSDAHARESARLATRMDPDYLAALTLTVIPGTPQARLEGSLHPPLHRGASRGAPDLRRRGGHLGRALPNEPRLEPPRARRSPAPRSDEDPPGHR
jgi:radical SAM superfamily enzyme YgiQ (UPF0313 family)